MQHPISTTTRKLGNPGHTQFPLMARLIHADGTLRTSAYRGWSQPVDATLYLEGEMECGLMGHKFHRGFTAAEKTELWDRWKRGESLKAIGRAFGKQSSSIYFLVAPHGGIRSAQRRRSRLTPLAEREVISRGVTAHQSARSIARLAWPLTLDGEPGNEPQWRL